MLGCTRSLFVLLIFIPATLTDLPPGCAPLETTPFSHANPADLFGSTGELNHKAAPQRTGNLRSQRPLPTHHFLTNQIKPHPVPMILIPYEATMSSAGITYDAYTMERWWDSRRSDEMNQQSAWESGQPWNKLVSMGTNMKQMVAGPDGNPSGAFTGKSGVRVGIAGSGEPELEDFGDLYANFRFSSSSGSMEVPLVRGSALLTHLFNNANPTVTPFCLSRFDGHDVTFDCPEERHTADGGSGHLSATCVGTTVRIQIDSSKPISDVTKVQYAIGPQSTWATNHGMINCDPAKCHLSNENKRIEIDVHNMHGSVAVAANYIGFYVLPPDWINHPITVSCPGKRSVAHQEPFVRLGGNVTNGVMRSDRGVEDISMQARCLPNGDVEIAVYVGAHHIYGIDKIQIALEPYNNWANPPAMRNCNDRACKHVGNIIYVDTHVNAHTAKMAINVIGYTTLPYHWISQPYVLTCGGPIVYSNYNFFHINFPSDSTNAPVTHPPVTHPPVTHSPITHAPFTTHAQTRAPTTTTTKAPTTTSTPGTTRAPNPGLTGHVVDGSGHKFIMELNEPGNELPNQTRKFVLYFSTQVNYHIDVSTSTVTFHPPDGGAFIGLMQLGYLGAGPRHDRSNDTFLDRHFGMYSYKPVASYCVAEDRNKVFAHYQWNLAVSSPMSSDPALLMVALPHHDIQLKNTAANAKQTTVYSYTGYRSDSWLLEMDLPRASMEPDQTAVDSIKANPAQLQDILAAIQRDHSQHNINGVCGAWDSYGIGKALGLSARLASISRAFGTQHYHDIDNQLKNCLEKWLRVQDTLSPKWKFHYEEVWGGLFLRTTDSGDLPFYADYGFPFYNDHHFHLGYFLYAIAYYVTHHQDWGMQHKERIYALARDVGNPSYSDPFFPVVRHKDIFMGFSWATGVVPGTRQEESSSEALNCYHGLAALGEAFGDSHMKHTGQVTLAMEIASVREYWHVRDHNVQHFPPILQRYGAVGQIAEGDFYVYTLDWGCDPNVFPMRHGCLVGIQVIPITAVSKYWMDADWAKHILRTCSEAIDPTLAAEYHKTNPADMRQLTTGWKAFCYAAMAPYDETHTQEAANFVKNKGPHDLVGGTGAASTLLFLYGRT